jgi:hypothetical protein
MVMLSRSKRLQLGRTVVLPGTDDELKSAENFLRLAPLLDNPSFPFHLENKENGYTHCRT